MELFIDEAGSFVLENAKPNSWCITGLYAFPNNGKLRYKKIIQKLKNRLGIGIYDEVKINNVPENIYIQFLKDLNSIKGTFFCVAINSFFNSKDIVEKHKNNTCQGIFTGIDKMIYQGGQDALKHLHEQFDSLPLQLYIQLICQVRLTNAFVDRGISYYVQRNPKVLENFRWKVDRKEPRKKLDFEDAFEKYAPMLMQTLSLKDPGVMVKEWDYSYMSEFIYKEGEVPEYLVEKFPYLINATGFNVQKIMRDDIQFIDSKASEGIQVVDLLSSGMRRLLRQEFNDNELVAMHLGKLMVEEKYKKPPLQFLSFDTEQFLDDNIIHIANILTSNAQSFFK